MTRVTQPMSLRCNTSIMPMPLWVSYYTWAYYNDIGLSDPLHFSDKGCSDVDLGPIDGG
jgi:hypothetical protein